MNKDKITFCNGKSECGCTLRISDGHGEYSDVHEITLCDFHKLVNNKTNDAIEERIKQIIPGHSRDCTFGRTDTDEGDFCTCNLRERKQKLREFLINPK
jgi:hypothetical protein